jgi:RNA polymerase sigma-70 factor (ECF subfamily)
MGHGLHSIFEQNRSQLLRYMRAHGAADDAEDLLHELWLKIQSVPPGPIGAPRNYLFRAATNLMIDRRRSALQEQRRQAEWIEVSDRLPSSPANDPGPDRQWDGRRRLAMVAERLEKLPKRAVQVFRTHRVDGRRQREVASDMGLSQSTVESDLRLVYEALDDLRKSFDEE